MDDLKKPMHQISGLAARAQLDEWILEYDRIEKETETLFWRFEEIEEVHEMYVVFWM